MSEAQSPAETKENFFSVAAPETLVPGINPVFLRDRLVVPLGADGSAMRWGMADPQDRGTLDALRFASRAPITLIQLPEATMRTLLGATPGLVERDVGTPASASQVPHADAVIRLRSHLIAAIAASADRVEIHSTGDLLMKRAGREVAHHDVGMVEADALTAAAVALATAPGSDDALGVPVAHNGKHMRVVIEPSATGVALLLAPNGSR